jgi:Tol biopolymer transport system component
LKGRHLAKEQKIPDPVIRASWEGVALSPDGESILIADPHSGRVAGLLLYSIAEEDIETIPETQGKSIYLPVWSPDGKDFIYTIKDRAWGLEQYRTYLVNKESSTKRLVKRGLWAELLKWSPDGRWIAGCGANYVFVIDTKSWKRKQIGLTFRGAFGANVNWCDQISWSPDGRYLAFAGWLKRGEMGKVGMKIYVWDSKTGELRCIAGPVIKIGKLSYRSFQHPAFSQDGKGVFFTGTTGHNIAEFSGAILMVDIKTREAKVLQEGASTKYGYPICVPMKRIPEASRSLEKEILNLIEMLGSELRKDRDRAVQSLLKIGLVAIPYLEKAKGHKDPEVRVRVRYLLDRLD